ncbi:uncharacterized protein LOC132682007 [Panthera onca]
MGVINLKSLILKRVRSSSHLKVLSSVLSLFCLLWAFSLKKSLVHRISTWCPPQRTRTDTVKDFTGPPSCFHWTAERFPLWITQFYFIVYTELVLQKKSPAEAQ